MTSLGPAGRIFGLRPSRTVLFCAAFMMVLLVALTAVQLAEMRRSEIDAAGRNLEKISLVVAEQAEASIQNVDLVLEGVASSLQSMGIGNTEEFLRRGSSVEVHELLKAKTAGLPQLDAVTLVGADGKFVNFSRYWPVPPVDVSDRDYFKLLQSSPSRRSYITDPVQNRGTGTWTLYISRRFAAADGTLIGIVLGSVELRQFEEFYRSIDLGPGTGFLLARHDGTILARHPSRGSEIGKEMRQFRQQVGELEAGRTALLSGPSRIDGEDRLMALRALRQFPLLVAIWMADDVALLKWRQQAVVAVAATLIALLAMAAVALVLVRHFRSFELLAISNTRAERAIAAQHAAEAASRAKDEFLATMSHELRTPLNAILGFSDVLKQELIGPVPPRYREYGEHIHEAGSHLLAIVNDILEVARAEAKASEAIEAVDVNQIAHQVVDLIARQAVDGGVTLAVDLDPALAPISSNAQRLRQAVLNLAANAVKFTESGGQVRIVTRSEPDGVRIEIVDTGIGIAPEDLPKVLAPFGQVDSSMQRRYQGTGLGLTIAKRFVENMGGEFGIDSTPMVGTRIVLRLPREIAQIRSIDPIPSPPADRRDPAREQGRWSSLRRRAIPAPERHGKGPATAKGASG